MTDADDAIRKILFGIEEPPAKSLFDQLLCIRNDAPPVSLPSVNSAQPIRPVGAGLDRLGKMPAVPLSSLTAMPLPPPPSPKGIRFSDAFFTEPSPFDSWLPTTAGIYAILVWDFACSPRPFRPIYFWEGDKFAIESPEVA
jgi:hypothetical protein